jgi:hypothetical protein
MTGLPKKYAKMGFKRGWAAFNRSKRKVRSNYSKKTKTKRFFKMARKKGYKRHYKKSSSGLSFGNVTKVLIGAGLAAVYETYVSGYIPLEGMIKNIVELLAGLMIAAMPRVPMPLKAFGTALAFINAWQIIIAYMPNQGSASGSNF